jgi:MFS transporter, DHA2 family, glioxin efflux transporter
MGACITHLYLLPVYFQSILGSSPISSAVHILPFIGGVTLTSILGAAFITSLGMPTYILMFGAILASVGSGLVYTFGADTPTGIWVGYLILLGLGYGFIIQIGIIVAQASCKPEDLAVATAAVSCKAHC